MAFVTTELNAEVGAIHPKAMPVMLAGKFPMEMSHGDVNGVGNLTPGFGPERQLQSVMLKLIE